MKKYFRLSILALAAFSLSSCLKDKNVVLDPDLSPPVVEFANVADIVSPQGAKYPLYVQSLNLEPTGKFNITINYTGSEPAPSDITVNVSLVGGTAAGTPIGDYNTEQDEHFVELPATMHDASNKTLTIPKGARSVSFPVNVKPSLFDLSAAYALAFKITSASSGTISKTFSTIVVSVGAKNRIDGAYNLKTTAGTSLQANLDHNNVPLVTTGATTVKTNLLDTYANIITYNVDPTTNKVTVVSVVNSIGTPITDPVSNYNPTTKVMYVKWTAGTRSFEETYTYQGSR